LTTYSSYAAENNTTRGRGGRAWLADGVTITGRLGSAASTAVVEPRAFTKGLMRAAEAHGAVLRYDTVVDLLRPLTERCAALRSPAARSLKVRPS
jgi:hypothetical protein